jgi:hypothetical protein
MEYNLQKTLGTEIDFEMNIFDGESEVYDDIIPGIGSIVAMNDIIVPLYHNSNFTTIVKEDDSEQLGGGQNEKTDNDNDNQVQSIDESVNIIENKDISKKRKEGEIDEGIHESFLHPKMFKTHSISLNGGIEKNNKIEKMKSERKAVGPKTPVSKKSVQKHKFNVY